MNNLEKTRHEVEKIYKESEDECMKTWFFENHVEVVAAYAEEIAGKSGADLEISVLAALFHDIARAWNIYEGPDLMSESLAKAEEIMKKYEYDENHIKQVKEAILFHSCKGKQPKTKEGKVLATADALAHLMTDFYIELPFNGWLKAAKTFEDYKKWVLEKIERDINKKIFFRKYKILAKKRHEALKIIFSPA